MQRRTEHIEAAAQQAFEQHETTHRIEAQAGIEQAEDGQHRQQHAKKKNARQAPQEIGDGRDETSRDIDTPLQQAITKRHRSQCRRTAKQHGDAQRKC